MCKSVDCGRTSDTRSCYLAWAFYIKAPEVLSGQLHSGHNLPFDLQGMSFFTYLFKPWLELQRVLSYQTISESNWFLKDGSKGPMGEKISALIFPWLIFRSAVSASFLSQGQLQMANIQLGTEKVSSERDMRWQGIIKLIFSVRERLRE